MTGTPAKQEILRGLSEAVVEMNDHEVVVLCKEALEKGIDAYTAISEGLTEGMKRAGERYNKGEYFIPELILCSDALYSGLDILTPHLKTSKKTRKRKMIIGVVEGDVHDIGKNLVKAMFTADGWEVDDLGSDVKLEVFGDEQKKVKADVVGLSALMTTSMLAIPEAIHILRRSESAPFILVGGAPLSERIAERYQADGYAADAVKATAVADDLLRNKPE
jgi:methanogenic corrinoid protein MtbC1